MIILPIPIIFTTLIILLLIAGVVITIFIANKQRIQREVAYEKELRTVENEVQEQVLMNVSRELHDNIGQMLTFMHLQLQRQKIDSDAYAENIRPVEETLANTIQQVKLLGRSLNTDMLEENGILKSIEQEITRLQLLKHITVNWQHDDKGEPVLNKDQKLMAFRIFQEVVNNALKHSGAKVLTVYLAAHPKFRLEVGDNGKGFDWDKVSHTAGGMGLKNIVKRAGLAGFKCEILASEGKGCIFIVEHP